MKKLNLVKLLAVLLVFNCSSDDNSNNTESQKTRIAKIEQKIFDFNNSSLLEERIVIDYSDGKQILWSFYNNNDDLTSTEEWNYSSIGYLISIKSFLADGSPYSEEYIIYDDDNRISQTTYSDTDSFNKTISFKHNNENTITANIDSNGANSSKVFELNSNGVIHKEIRNGNIIVSVDYNNLNPITKTTSFTTYSYEYLDNGSFPSTCSIFGTNPANVVLFGNSLSDQSDSLTSELISKITSDSSSKEFIYSLDDNGYPISMQSFYDGNLRNEFKYTYE